MSDSIYVIGGGPSLLNFDFNRLRYKNTIVINNAIFNVPLANYFITLDYTFFRKIDISKFNAYKTKENIFVYNFSNSDLQQAETGVFDSRCKIKYDFTNKQINSFVSSNEVTGFGYSYEDFRNGDNSGYCGLQLAIILGYKEIKLLGFDLNFSENITHFHTNYRTNAVRFKDKLDMYYKTFVTGLSQLHGTDINVYSLTENGRLNNVIPYISVEDDL